MICGIFLPIMPAIFAYWGEKYNLAQIWRIFCALEKEVQSCAYIEHWRNMYNLAHILRIGKEIQSCAYTAHWRNSTILRKRRGKKYNLAQMLRIHCAWGKKYNLAQMLRIGEISTILRKPSVYIVHWERILRIYCALTHPIRNLRKIQ